MEIAYICSPYKGNIIKRIRNIRYAKRLTKIALKLGYAPIAPHLYMTRVLNDNIVKERLLGLDAGMEILARCDTIIIGVKYGVSVGMEMEISEMKEKNNIVIG